MHTAARRGYFISFEGLDGSGKTTQMKLLAERLRELGREVVVTRQPGGTAMGDRIRALLLDSRQGFVAPMAEMAMMFADRAQAIAEVIEPALAAGKVVLCDRFTDSTEAYQGGGRELGSALVLEMDALVCGGLRPNLTVLLLPDLATSLTRARRRNQRQAEGVDEGRFEAEKDAFFERTWAKFEEIARREPERVVALRGDGGIQAMHAEVVRVVMGWLG